MKYYSFLVTDSVTAYLMIRENSTYPETIIYINDENDDKSFVISIEKEALLHENLFYKPIHTLNYKTGETEITNYVIYDLKLITEYEFLLSIGV